MACTALSMHAGIYTILSKFLTNILWDFLIGRHSDPNLVLMDSHTVLLLASGKHTCIKIKMYIPVQHVQLYMYLAKRPVVSCKLSYLEKLTDKRLQTCSYCTIDAQCCDGLPWLQVKSIVYGYFSKPPE